MRWRFWRDRQVVEDRPRYRIDGVDNFEAVGIPPTMTSDERYATPPGLLTYGTLVRRMISSAVQYEEDLARLRKVLGSDLAYDAVSVYFFLNYAKGYPLARAITIAVELACAGMTPAQLTTDGHVAKVVEQHELLYGSYCTHSRETIIETARNYAKHYVEHVAQIDRPYDWKRDGL